MILTGAGDVFSAGYDIGNLTPEKLADRDLLTHPFEAALAALDAVAVPVVAAMNGHAFGGGLELALACDLRVCAPRAKLGMPPARLGVVYSHTGLQRFVDAIGSARTRELFLTAQPIDAATALALGPRQRARRGRRRPRGRARGPHRDACAAVAEGHQARARGAARPTEADCTRCAHEAFRSADFAEGVRAFIEKRPPALLEAVRREPYRPGQRHSDKDRGCWISRTAWTSSTSSGCTSACGWSPDRRGRAWCSTGGRCCCCARATRSGSPIIRKVRQAAADAAMRWGVGAGAARVRAAR